MKLCPEAAAHEFGSGGSGRPRQLLLVSARTPGALEASSTALADYLDHSTPKTFADAALALQVKGSLFEERRFTIAVDSADAAKLLRLPDPLFCGSKRCDRRNPNVCFIFGGEGTQYLNMGRSLNRYERLFRTIVDDCCGQLASWLGLDLRELLYPQPQNEDVARQSLQQALYYQCAIFVTEYALARLWQKWGVLPAMMVGHGIGEMVAATLAGVWKLADALRIVALRGNLMQVQPHGSMLAVNIPPDELNELLPSALQIASIEAPSLCVVSGPDREIASFAELLQTQGMACHSVCASHAYNSAMMDPVVDPLRAELAKVKLHPPTRPFVSAVTGRPISADQATDPEYWARQIRVPVLFSKSLQWLVDWGYDLFLECGPGSNSCTLVRQHSTPEMHCVAVPSLGERAGDNAEWNTLLFALGTMWQNGVSIDWCALNSQYNRNKIALPALQLECQWEQPEPVSVAFMGSGARENDMLNSMLDIWKRGLDVPAVGPDDDFFMLGGRSTVAAEIFIMIEKEWGFKMPLAMPAGISTPRAMVRMLEHGVPQSLPHPMIGING